MNNQKEQGSFNIDSLRLLSDRRGGHRLEAPREESGCWPTLERHRALSTLVDTRPVCGFFSGYISMNSKNPRYTGISEMSLRKLVHSKQISISLPGNFRE